MSQRPFSLPALLEALPFQIEQAVTINGDRSMPATVSSILIGSTGVEVKLAWVSGGNLRHEWVPLSMIREYVE